MRTKGEIKLKSVKIVAIWMLLLWVVGIAGVQAQTQDGTEEHPFLIGSAAQLKQLRDCINSDTVFYFDGTNFTTVRNASYQKILPYAKGKYFRLTADIVLNAGDVAGCGGEPAATIEKWIPIKSFSGRLDGANHLISGMYVDLSLAYGCNEAGLFAQLADTAYVKNLGLVNCYARGYRYVAGIAAIALNHSEISNCFVYGTFACKQSHLGAIVSSILGSSSVSHCYSTGRIVTSAVYVGGIVGFNNPGCQIDDCYSSISIESKNASASGIYGVLENASVTNCFYDKQMCNKPSDESTPMLTGAMLGTMMSPLLDNDFFGFKEGMYPYLKSFDYDNQPYVRLSCVPILLSATSSSAYNTLDNLDENFSVGTVTGGTWSSLTYNNSGQLNSDGETVRVIKEGWLQLAVEYDGVSRVYEMVVHTGAELGSEGHPYASDEVGNAFTIDSIGDLLRFKAGMASSTDFVYKRNIVSAANRQNIHWLQTVDLDLSSIPNWDPIKNFTGFYDGNGKKITQMTIAGEEDYRGFFSSLSNSTIRNLHFEQARVSGKNYCGVLAYTVNSGATVEECSVKNSVVESATGGYLGSIAGLASGESAFIRSCRAEDVQLKGKNSLGGICGKSSSANIVGCRSKNCTFSTSAYYVGGILGYMDATVDKGIVSSCVNEGGHVDAASCVGGIVGSVGGTSKTYYTRGGGIDHCYNQAAVTARSSYAGGICGNYGFDYVDTLIENHYHTYIRDCYNAGKVDGKQRTGGIAGQCAGYVERCLNIGDVCGRTSDSGNPICGIVGYGVTTCRVNDCANMGKITGSQYSINAAAGIMYYGTVSNCFNSGEIVGELSYAGAITAWSSYASKQCLNIAQVNSRHDVSGAVSTASGTSSNCYDKQMCTQFSIPDNAVGFTTAQLIGTESSAKAKLGTEHWIYTDGLYPRLKWTDTCSLVRDWALTAAMPLQLAANDNVERVNADFTVAGCDSSCTWTKVSGNLFSAFGAACSDNKQSVEIAAGCVQGPTVVTVSAPDGKVCKNIILRRFISSFADTITIDNLADLRELRNKVNTCESFNFKGYCVPRFADSVVFKLTADIDLASESNWVPIGGVDYMHRFGGHFLGEGHVIRNLKSQSQSFSGLFGRVRGSIIRDLTMEDVNIMGGKFRGAICSQMMGATIENCVVTGVLGGTCSTNGYSGGIAGYSSNTVRKDTIRNCVNRADVSTDAAASATRLGGIIGYGNNPKTSISNCTNYGNVTSTYRVGGIVGDGGKVQYCSNAGKVLGYSSSEYVGGIAGANGNVSYSFNTGTVEALTGNSSSNTYVAGVVGHGDANYCYNAGMVEGSNRKYVGGVKGSGAANYCYNVGSVVGGANVAAISATGGTGSKYCFYDKQMCVAPGLPTGDVENVAVGLSTLDLLGNTVISTLIPATQQTEWGNTKWIFEEGLYPRLKDNGAGHLAFASVMPILLQNDENVTNVATDFPMRGCNVGEWSVLMGTCLVMNTTNPNCNTSISAAGIAKIGAGFNDTVYKVIRLLIQVSEENPLLIKSLTELKNFRDGINSDLFYYYMPDSTYHLSLTASDSAHLENFIEIIDGGRDLYFKLTTDIDMAEDTAADGTQNTWVPIGDNSHNATWFFKGSFTGADHTITNLKIGNGTYQGLFGRTADATIKNLHLTHASLSGSGEKKGALCGVLYGGSARNCSVSQSTAAGNSKYVGLLFGEADYCQVSHCHSSNDSLLVSGERGGGITGYSYYAKYDTCYSDHLVINCGGANKGGLVGYLERSRMDGCYNVDGQFDVTAGYVGGICGTVCGNSVESIVLNSYNKNTVINTNSQNAGGIAGYVYHTYARVINCYSEGGSITSTSNPSVAGGIVGYSYYSQTGANISNCVNRTPVVGLGTVGGICGYLKQGTIDSCINEAKVIGKERVGGVCGLVDNASPTSILHCTNRGEVSGIATSFNCYVGGICGLSENTVSYCTNEGYVHSEKTIVGGIAGSLSSSGSISYCINVGDVTANAIAAGICAKIAGSSTTQPTLDHCHNSGMVETRNESAAGIIADLSYGRVNNCSNVGIIYGNSCVGGIVGRQRAMTTDVSNCYNAGWVKGDAIAGAICGKSDAGRFANCYYDSQMSFSDGIMGSEVAGKAEGRLTTQMLGTQLESALGTANWIYAAGMYPRLSARAHEKVSVVAAMPVILPTDVTAKYVPTIDFTANGCDSISWVEVLNSALTISGCDFSAVGKNYVDLGARIAVDTVDGTPILDTLKRVRLSIRISDEDPVEITSLENLKRFRTLLNTGQTFYYEPIAKLFYADPDPSYTTVKPYGEEMFFKLTTDIDLSTEVDNWIPVAHDPLYENGFRGVFDGDNHTITGMRIVDLHSDGAGFFGTNKGTIRNLHLVNPYVYILEGASGVCAYNCGRIENCSSVGGEIISPNGYAAGISGWMANAEIHHCYNATAIKGASEVGGIGGYADMCVISHCYNVGLVSSNDGYAAGGILGETWETSEISYCYNAGAVYGGVSPQAIGGIIGEGDGAYVHDCYNVGTIGDRQFASQSAAISTQSSVESVPVNTYYDSQMSAIEGGWWNGTEPVDLAGHAEGYETVDMLGNALESALGTDHWVFQDGLYPRLKGMHNTDIAIAAATPIFITEHLPADNLATAFSVSNENGVTWSRYGTGNSLDIAEINGTGRVSIRSCGYDTLKVTLNDDYKLVPLNVDHIEGYVFWDTTCGGSFVWPSNGREYVTTGDYTQMITISPSCDSVITLHLYVPDSIRITLDNHDVSCFGTNDGYVHPDVSGGSGRGFVYRWTKDGTDFSSERDIDNLAPGLYELTVYDSLHWGHTSPSCKHCSETRSVEITQPTQLQASVLSYDSHCYGESDGVIVVHLEGAVPSYRITWDRNTDLAKDTIRVDVASDYTIDNLKDGFYHLTVLDAHSCKVDLDTVKIVSNETLYKIASVGQTRLYDGTSLSSNKYTLAIGSDTPVEILSGANYTLPTGDVLNVTLSCPSITNVGSVANTVTAFTIMNGADERTCRYHTEVESNQLVVTPRRITVASIDSTRKYMEGVPLTAPRVVESGDGWAAGQGASYSNFPSREAIGIVSNTFDITLNDVSYASNYQLTPVYGNLRVVPENCIVVTPRSVTKEYDGTPLTATEYDVVGTIGATDTLIAVIAGAITNVGTDSAYVSSYRIENKTTHADVTADYLATTTVYPFKAALKVTPRDVMLYMAGESRVYSGDTLRRPDVTVGGSGWVPGEVSGVTATAAIVNVGTQANNTYRLDTVAGRFLRSNYQITVVPQNLVITPRPLVVRGSSATYAYNGHDQQVSTFTAPSLALGHTISGFTYNASGRTVGTYSGAFSNTTSLAIRDAHNNDVTADYDVSFETGSLTIVKNNSRLQIKSNTKEDFIYDATKHTYYNYLVKFGENSYTAVAGRDTLFVLSTGDTLTILPRNAGRGIVNVVESGKNDFTYTLQHPDCYDELAVILDTGRIAIQPRPVLLESGDKIEYYNGLPHMNTVVNRTGMGFVLTQDVYCVNFPAITNVGEIENSFTYSFNAGTDPHNYEITKRYGRLKILPAMLTLNVVDTFRLYGNENPLFRYTISGFAHGEDTTSAPFVGSARPVLTTVAIPSTHPGIYPIEVDLTGVSFQNYEITATSGNLTVRKRVVEIVANSLPSRAYDGLLHTWRETGGNGCTVLGSGLMTGDTVRTVVVAGSRILAGQSDITVQNAHFYHFVVNAPSDTTWTNVDDCYTASYTNGAITITPVELKLRSLSYTHEFDGNTYSSANTPSPHYEILSGALVPNDTLVAVPISGSRSYVGSADLVIDSANIVIVDKVEVSDYEHVTPAQNMLGGYHITFENGTVEVTDRLVKYPIVVEGKSATVTYNGSEQQVTGLVTDTYLVDGHTYTVTGVTSKAIGILANDYVTTFTGTPVVNDANGVDVTSQFNITMQPGVLHINKRPIQLTARDCSVEYDGREHTYAEGLSPFCDVTSGSLCVGHNLRTATDGSLSGARTIPGTSAINIDPDVVVINNMALDNVRANYEITVVPGTLTITHRTTPLAISVKSKSDTVVYNGEVQTLTGFDTLRFTVNENIFSVEGLSALASGKDTNNYANAISGAAIVKDANDNDVTAEFTVSNVEGNFRIVQRPIELIANSLNVKYDGEGHSVKNTTAPYFHLETASDLVTGHTITADVLSDTIIVVGSTSSSVKTPVVIKDADNAVVTNNYKIALTAGEIEVTPNDTEIEVASGTRDFTFDGSLHKYENYSVTYGSTIVSPVASSDGKRFALPTGDTLTITPTFAGITTVSENTPQNNTFTYALQHNDYYVGTRSTTIGTVTISKANMTVKLDTTKWFDGTQFISNYAVDHHGFSFVGLAAADAVTAGSVTTPGTTAGTYADVAGANVTVPFATTLGIDNYVVTYDLKQVIAKAPLTVKLDSAKVYDGTVLVCDYTSSHNGYTISGLAAGDAITAGAVTTPSANAGTYADITGANVSSPFATTLGISNYDISYDLSQKITPRTGVVVTIQEHGAEYEYDGTLKSATGYGVTINDPLYHESDISFSGSATVSGMGAATTTTIYPMTLSSSQFSNNSSNFQSVTFVIVDSALYIYPTLAASATNLVAITCHGASNGQADIVVAGGKKNNGKYAFSIDGGASAMYASPHTFDNLDGGSHTVRVTDSLNYDCEVTFTIDEGASLVATIVPPTDLCPNQGSYPVSVNVTGGTPAYHYAWSDDAANVDAANTAVTQSAPNDGGDTYTVSVQIVDDNGCVANASQTFTVNPSVRKPGSVNYTCTADIDTTMRYGIYDISLTLTPPTWTSNIPTMPLTLVNDAPTSHRFGVLGGREDSTYTIHWRLVDTCGADTLICTQLVVVRFPECLGSVADAEGTTYQVQRLGANCWTRANQRNSIYSPATAEPNNPSNPSNPNNPNGNVAQPTHRGLTRDMSTGMVYYNDDAAHYSEFGYLYTWYAASHVPNNDDSAEPIVIDGHVQGACPTNWALPTLEDYLLMEEAAGGMPHVKVASTTYWAPGLEGILPSCGFDAKGAGYYSSIHGAYEGLLTVARFWTCTPTGDSVTGTAVQCSVCNGTEVIIESKKDAYSIRCVRIR